MQVYNQERILRIAKRFNNTKRSYLLVNPLQAKHLPVKPSESLEMMKTLGHQLARKYPNTTLVVGFAETATAIGAVVADCMPAGCVYIHTTRENYLTSADWILFLEEHSHAVEQKLDADNLLQYISSSQTIIFVDDEISTGKTLINMISQLKKKYPVLCEKELVAASLLNRVSDANLKKMNEIGIKCEFLVKLEDDDYEQVVRDVSIEEAVQVKPVKLKLSYQALKADGFSDPRIGVKAKTYMQNCSDVAEEFCARFLYRIAPESRVLVLGTEECMYPALAVAEKMEQMGDYCVFCHATTRSPIGVCSVVNYPIHSGSKIQSFYSNTRDTYIYNLGPYDAVVVVSDTPEQDFTAMENLMGAFKEYDCTFNNVFYIQGGRHVWYV